MTTPARAHKQRTEALKAHASRSLTDARPYDIMLAKLHADMGRLRDIQSVEKKIELKVQLLPTYAAWVEGALASHSGQQDDILTNVMVWSLDAGQYEQGLTLAEYALSHGMVAPERYKRSLGCLVAEIVADTALKSLSQGGLAREAAQDWAKRLGKTSTITESHDMPDEVRAKLNKAYGLVNEQCGQHEGALLFLRRALELNQAAGVKKDIERIERTIRNSAGKPA